MATVRSVVVRVGADVSELQRNMKQAQKTLSNSGKELAKIGTNLTKSITAPLLGIGATLIKTGDSFEKAYNKIRIGTGATGKQLELLKKDFLEVFKIVPDSMESVSTAIADLNTRLGLSGVELQKLSEQMINLSKISGEDLAGTISTTTRVFGDWGISTQNLGTSLDFLFKSSQATGISVGKLGTQLVAYGAPLRQLGFDFETASVLMSKFEKEGVNTELVLGSLRIALGKMAKAGISDTKLALEQITNSIKNAGSVGEANAIALEHFGSRAGADMASAIREGRFEINQLIKDLKTSDESINNTAESTRTFGDNMKRITNVLAVAFEPLSGELLKIIKDLQPEFEKITSQISVLAEKFIKLNPNTKKSILLFAAISAIIPPIIIGIGAMVTAVGSILGALAGLSATTGVVIGVLGGLSAIFVTLYAKSKSFRDNVKEVITKAFTEIKEVVQRVMPIIKEIIDSTLNTIHLFWKHHGESVIKIGNYIFEKLSTIVTYAWTFIKDYIFNALNIIKNVIQLVGNVIEGDWSGVWDNVKNIFTSVWDFIKSFALNIVGTIIVVFTQMRLDIANVFNDMKDNLLKKIRDMKSNFVETFKEIGVNILIGLGLGIASKVSHVIGKVKDLGESIKDKFKSVLGIHSPSTVMAEFGKNIGEGLLNGIVAITPTIIGSMKTLADMVVDEMERASRVLYEGDKMFARVGGTGSKVYSELSSAQEGVKAEKEYYSANKSSINKISKERGVDIGIATAMYASEKGENQYAGAKTGSVTWNGQVYHNGGIVDKLKPKEIPALLEEGEMVLNKEQQRGLGGINITVTGNTISNDMDIDKIGEKIIKKLKTAGVRI
jgi:TP901 family phage tail tape measure protein